VATADTDQLRYTGMVLTYWLIFSLMPISASQPLAPRPFTAAKPFTVTFGYFQGCTLGQTDTFSVVPTLKVR